MNNKEFIETIIETVRNTTISDVIEDLKEPPGRSPIKRDIELSDWYLKLSVDDIDKIKEVITNAVDDSIFGILAVLDGVRAIENHHKGLLELSYIRDNIKTVLNNSKDEYLHDIYNNMTR